MCTITHTHTYYARVHALIDMQLKLILSHLIGPHRNQVNNPPQQKARKSPAEDSHAQ